MIVNVCMAAEIFVLPDTLAKEVVSYIHLLQLYIYEYNIISSCSR